MEAIVYILIALVAVYWLGYSIGLSRGHREIVKALKTTRARPDYAAMLEVENRKLREELEELGA